LGLKKKLETLCPKYDKSKASNANLEKEIETFRMSENVLKEKMIRLQKQCEIDEV